MGGGQSSADLPLGEMSHDVIESRIYLWFTRIFDLFLSAFITFILIHSVYSTYVNPEYGRGARSQTIDEEAPTTNDAGGTGGAHHVPSRSRSRRAVTSGAPSEWSRDVRLLHAVTTAFFCVSWICQTFNTLNIWAVFPAKWNCTDLMIFYSVTLNVSKALLSLIFLIRLKVAFDSSPVYRYSRVFIGMFSGFITLWTFVIIGSTKKTIQGVWLTDPVKWCHIHIRENGFSKTAIILWIFVNFAVSVILLYAFLMPLNRLLKSVESMTPERALKSSMGKLAIRYSILSWMALLTSAIGLITYLYTHITTLIDFELFLNSLCVLLMSRVYQSWYAKLCFVCDQGVTKCEKQRIASKYSKFASSKVMDHPGVALSALSTNSRTSTLALSGDASSARDKSRGSTHMSSENMSSKAGSANQTGGDGVTTPHPPFPADKDDPMGESIQPNGLKKLASTSVGFPMSVSDDEAEAPGIKLHQPGISLGPSTPMDLSGAARQISDGVNESESADEEDQYV